MPLTDRYDAGVLDNPLIKLVYVNVMRVYWTWVWYLVEITEFILFSMTGGVNRFQVRKRLFKNESSIKKENFLFRDIQLLLHSYVKEYL